MADGIRVPLSKRSIATCVIFSAIAVFLGIVGPQIIFNSDPVYMEDGEVMSLPFKLFFGAVLTVVEAGILVMSVSLWVRIISGRGAMVLTENGIEDTFFIFSIFAFWTTMRVRIIPWSAIKSISADDCNIEIDLKGVPENSCNKLARFILRGGFNYAIGRITDSEIKEYIRRKQIITIKFM